jgi:hypothetical protein
MGVPTWATLLRHPQFSEQTQQYWSENSFPAHWAAGFFFAEWAKSFSLDR